MLSNKIQTSIIGLSGMGGIEAVQQVQSVSPETINDSLGIVSQIVILIVTLIGLFKKKKVTETKN